MPSIANVFASPSTQPPSKQQQQRAKTPATETNTPSPSQVPSPTHWVHSAHLHLHPHPHSMLRDEGRDHDDAMELMALAEAAEAAELEDELAADVPVPQAKGTTKRALEENHDERDERGPEEGRRKIKKRREEGVPKMHKTPIAPSSPAHSPAGAAASPASDDKPRSDYEIMAQLDGIAVDGVGEEPPLADIDDDDAPSSKVPETPGLSTAKKDTLPPARTPTESNISSKSTQLTSTTMSATPSASTIRNSPASNEADEEDEFNPLDDVDICDMNAEFIQQWDAMEAEAAERVEQFAKALVSHACCLAHQVSANLHTQFEQTRKKLERGAMDIKDEEAKQAAAVARFQEYIDIMNSARDKLAM